MDKKIRELKLDEIKAVAGGAYTATLSTSYIKPTTTFSASSQLIKPTSTPLLTAASTIKV